MKRITARKWFYPLVYFILIVIAMLPPITQRPYDPRNTQDVIIQILQVSLNLYQGWGWVFRLGTLGLVALIAFRVTAFNGLIYGFLNLTHWFAPGMIWMGVLHIPLLVIPLTALILSYRVSRRTKMAEKNES